MKRFLSWLDDRAHPIVLKELRQAAQGRFLGGMLLTLVLVQLLAVCIFLLNNDLNNLTLLSGGGFGEQVFTTLVIVLLVLGVLCLPIYTAARFVTERNGEDLALLFISTLPPHRIILGKLVSSWVLAGLMICLCLPFMAFTYFLRGIDLLTMAKALTVVVISMTCAIVFAIFIAAIPVKRLARLLIMASAFIALLWWLVWTLILVIASIERNNLVRELGDGVTILLFLCLTLACLVLLFLLAVAMIAPLVSNRAKPVRSFLSLMWLVGGAVSSWIWFDSGLASPMEGWVVVSLLSFSTALVVATSAPDQINRRLRGELPTGFLAKIREFLLLSGSANGIAWALVGMVTTMAWAGFSGLLGEPDSRGMLFKASGFSAYLLSYCLLAIRLQRGKLKSRMQRHQTWVIAMLAIAAGSFVPPLILFLVSFGRSSRLFDEGYWLILNPFAVEHDVVGGFASGLALLSALLMLYLQFDWLKAQVVDFFRRSPVQDSKVQDSRVPVSSEGDAG